MVKKIFVFGMIISFILSESSPVFSQLMDFQQLVSKVEKETAPKKAESGEGGYETFVCPSCGREFGIKIDPNDLEFQKGIKKIVCPYDGTELFYPRQLEAEEPKLQYETVKCPTCGRDFKAEIDIRALLSGRSQVLICPYDKKKFYFKSEGLKPAVFTWANLYTVICPTDKRTFKAYLDPNNLRELVCPYDGTRFFPTPELIVKQHGPLKTGTLQETVSSLGAGQFQGVAEEKQIETAPQAGEIAGTGEKVLPEETSSRIEEQFSENIPLTVSKTIKQFGYDVFKPVEISEGRFGKEEYGMGAGEGTPESKLLRAMFGQRQQEGLLSGGAAGQGGLSIFSAPTEIPVISDYVLGPGDTLVITIWGQIQEAFPVTVDSEGKIMLPKAGPLYLWGKKFSDAEKLIRENMLKAYTNIQISVSLGKIRGIKVFVLGEAKKPGAYVISALSNSFHALYAAGGPTKLGSMRKIKLIRKENPEMPIDLYNILLKGDNTQDYKLYAGDTIFIPPIGDVAGIAGNVKRPAIYELKEKIKLGDIIEMAGGFSSVGYLQRIQLERIQEHLRKTVVDLEFKSISDLKNSPNNLELQDGDLVLILPIIPIRYNFVSITGNVLRAGDYELKGGMRLKDLIEKAGGILPGTYLKRAEIARFKGDKTREVIPVSLIDLMDGKEEANILLNEWDVIAVYSKKEVLPDLFVEIDGAVSKPGRYELTENMKISDLIFKARGLTTEASMSNAELFRSFSDGPKLIKLDLNKVISKSTDTPNNNDLALEEGDHLFIRKDMSREDKVVVTLSGEFIYPGKYAVEKGTHISAVIERAGGFTKNAFLDGSFYTRESVKLGQQKMIKRFLDFEQNAFLQEQASLAVGATNAQIEARTKQFEYRQRLIKELGTVQPPGRILIRISADMRKFRGSEYNILIEDGDTLNVPGYPSTVQVIGNVYGSGAIAYSDSKGIDYYINRAGGLTRAADSKRIFLIRANGETVSAFVRAVKVKRGDAIIVPEEFKYRTLPGLFFKDVVQVIYQATLGAAVTVAAVNAL